MAGGWQFGARLWGQVHLSFPESLETLRFYHNMVCLNILFDLRDLTCVFFFFSVGRGNTACFGLQKLALCPFFQAEGVGCCLFVMEVSEWCPLFHVRQFSADVCCNVYWRCLESVAQLLL